MKLLVSHVCLCCHQPFTADRRNAHHQEYCAAPACRQASKTASQLRWLAKPENQKYHSGEQAVTRVRACQVKDPKYRERQNAKRRGALQDVCFPPPEPPPKSPAIEEKPVILPTPIEPVTRPLTTALQDVFMNQPLVFVGLIAHFFGFALQDDIAKTIRLLQQLGEDITNGKATDEILKAAHIRRPPTLDPGPI